MCLHLLNLEDPQHPKISNQDPQHPQFLTQTDAPVYIRLFL